MNDQSNEIDAQEQEDSEYIIIPEEAVKLLPQEWQKDILKIAEDGRAILSSVDNELSQLSKLTKSFNSVVTLKRIQLRLLEHKFEPTMEWLLDLETLITAFVVNYVRLHQGGGESGFARDVLPPDLRAVHDQILELRNERYAHSSGHHSISDAMEIEHENDSFKVNMGLSVRIQVGGTPEWKQLVEALDEVYANRMEKLFMRLRDKTGYNWSGKEGAVPS